MSIQSNLSELYSAQAPSLAIGSSVTGATAGSVFFAGASGVMAQDNANLFWDAANTQLRLKQTVSYVHPLALRQSSIQDPYGFYISFQNSVGTQIGEIRANAGIVVFENGPFAFSPNTAGTVPVTLQLAAAQTADALQVKNSGGTVIAEILADGQFQSGNASHNGAGFTYWYGTIPRATLGGYANNGAALALANDTAIGWTSSVFATGINVGIGRFADGVLNAQASLGSTRAFLGGGTAVASATALPLPTGRVFHVTGTTTITSITSTNFGTGVVITLIFDDVLTFTDGNNLKLAGDFVTTADDTITLVYDGSNWHEVCRSVN